ncbi:hypothetical protein [Nonomuraea rhodomycinica]|uniref:Uncharacterized protein n=1 Tax=Nonomuraea rhodomycinica TaxID=1712872 RepID=A0A7Y6IWA1_9ACTN|nr:hypothetical protein [Nonomuraea rhodomycinica]NUW45008.1 hypothetical protein [Nonomuraea rhodomycinica]
MPIDQGELRHLLDERSRPALDRPVPWHSLRAGTRSARRRRLSAVTAAAAVAVAAVAAVTAVSLRGPEDVDRPTVARMSEKFPVRYQESDGTVYRRLAVVAFDPSKERSKTFQVKVSGKPVAVLPECPPETSRQPQISARVPGTARTYTLSPVPFLANACTRGMAMDMTPFPAGTRRATFTITARHDAPAGKWRFGVYEWAPPVTMRAPAPPVEPPAKIREGLDLVTRRSVTWPGAREVTLTVPNTGRTLAVVAYCGDNLGERLLQQLWVNGRMEKGAIDCSIPPGARGLGFTVLGKRPQAEKTVTVKVRVTAPVPEYLLRPGTLTVAVYDGFM